MYEKKYLFAIYASLKIKYNTRQAYSKSMPQPFMKQPAANLNKVGNMLFLKLVDSEWLKNGNLLKYSLKGFIIIKRKSIYINKFIKGVFMKLLRHYFVYVFVFSLIGLAFILSSCATTEQRQATPYASPLQEILYGKSPGAKDSTSTRDTQSLGNTRWRIASIHPVVENQFKNTEFFFERSGVLVEAAELPNGTIYTDTHRYRVLGSTLVLTKDGFTAVALFRIEGDTLNIDGDNYRLILNKINK